jgi:hypothetical protein
MVDSTSSVIPGVYWVLCVTLDLADPRFMRNVLKPMAQAAILAQVSADVKPDSDCTGC